MTEFVESPADVVLAGGAEPAMPVGDQLRLAREGKGLEIADIAQMLKLGQRQVEALEGGNWQGLPGHTFIRGFVRNYARLVQIDPLPLMAQLDESLAKPVDNLAMHGTQPATMPSGSAQASLRDRTVVLVGAGLLGLAVLAYFLIPGDLSGLREQAQSLIDGLGRKDAAVPAAQAPPAQAAAEPVFPPGSTPQQVMYPQVLAPAEQAVPAPVAAVSAGAPPTGMASAANAAPQLRLVFEKESWVEVRDRDNRVIFSQRLGAGTEQSLAGQGPLSLTVGYAPGVKLFWRGEVVDLAPHTKADVARLVVE